VRLAGAAALLPFLYKIHGGWRAGKPYNRLVFLTDYMSRARRHKRRGGYTPYKDCL
jgi:hypothetical protein